MQPDMLSDVEALKDALNGFAKPDWAVGKRKFRISKMGALKAFQLGEKVRHALAQVDINPGAVAGGNKSDMALGVLLQGVLSLPPATVEEIRDELFEHADFSGDDIKKGWLNVGQNMDMAFKDLEARHVYELMVRSLVVNFFGSFAGLISDLSSPAKSSRA